jgi:hypothetical protein
VTSLHEYTISIGFVFLFAKKLKCRTIGFFFREKELFQLSGYINSQKNRVWSAKNPHALHKNPVRLSTTGVWCTGSRRQIAGLLFFEQIITEENYQKIL